MVSETDKAYLAGFLDGEGYINISSIRRVTQLKMAVVNTDLSVIRELQELWGGGIALKKRSSILHKQGYELRWFKEIPYILTEVLPYLKVKRKQAQLGLQFALTGDFRGKKEIPNTAVEQRLQIRARLQEVNKRGANKDAH